MVRISNNGLTNMTKLIVFTDLHMVPEGTSIIGLDPFQRLSAGIAHVNRYHPDADRVIVMGDLAHQADRPSYERLKGLLDQLVAPHHLPSAIMTGATSFSTSFRMSRRTKTVSCSRASIFPTAVSSSSIRCLRRLTTIPAAMPGFLCAKRLAWLDRRLETAGGLPVLLFMHHPPHATGFTGMDLMRLINEVDFYDVVKRHGNVLHIFAGHVHRTISGSQPRHPLLRLQEPGASAADAFRHAGRLAFRRANPPPTGSRS